MTLKRFQKPLSCALISLLALLSACQPAATSIPLPAPTLAPSASAVLPPTVDMPSSTTTSPPPVITPTFSPRLCSPIENVPLEQLSGQVSNPYSPPPPGSDSPHQGVDLAVVMPGSNIALPLVPVRAALSGTTAAVILGRFPYGNAVLIETPIDAAIEAWLAPAAIPTPGPTLAPGSALTCPDGPPPVFVDTARRSLYVLYAHLQEAPEAALSVGTEVSCGQAIGQTGSSGNALNPHLHFEVRVGPAGLRPGSMAHYDANASLEEMRSYCLWRVSGWFQLVDPMKLLQLPPT